ncbi:DUF3782 domain-containing protein [Candidatus Magnetomoraceae bacterium gMMP-1]
MDIQVIEKGFERVWQMFQETDRRLEEKFQETDRKFQETDRKFQETDRRLEEKFQETDRKFQETDRKFQETDRRFQESAEQLKKIEDLFIGKWGRFMEVLVNSGALTALRNYEVSVNHSASNVKEQKPNGHGRGMEIDVLCWSRDLVVPIEVKTTLKVEHVKEQEKRLSRFFKCFPTFSGRKLHGAVAGLSFAEEADKYAYRRGLYVLTLVGENMLTIVNDNKFRPKEWAV